MASVSAPSWAIDVIPLFFGRARSTPAADGVLACGWLGGRLVWARVDDESKRRCQGLVVCRATLPLEGFCDARPGVTLAPAFFFGVAACQSETIRL